MARKATLNSIPYILIYQIKVIELPASFLPRESFLEPMISDKNG